MLNNIRIILKQTSHPGNVGAVARAMKNMALAKMYLIQPCQFLVPEALARAANAKELLTQAIVKHELKDAIADCQLVFGLSARDSSLRLPSVAVREAANLAKESVIAAKAHDIAFVFGPENNGLSKEDLQQCDYIVHIPANSRYSSLNLAQAVQVLSYELFMAFKLSSAATAATATTTATKAVAAASLASHKHLDAYFVHLEEVLSNLGFFNPAQQHYSLARLRRIFCKAQLEYNEVQMLRGILSMLEKKLQITQEHI